MRIISVAVTLLLAFVAVSARGDVIGLDLDQASVSDSFSIGFGAEGITTDGSTLWAMDTSTTLFSYDISGGGFSSLGSITTAVGGVGLAWDGSGLWIDAGNTYTKISSDNGSIITSFAATTPTGSPGGLTYDDGTLWKASRPEFNQIDIATGDVISSISGFDLPGIEEGLAFDGRFLYAISYTSSLDPTVWKIDSTTGLLQADSFSLPNDVYNGLTFDGQNLWAAGFGTQTLYKISSPTTVSEPGTLALFGIGLAGMGLARRRRLLS